VQGGAARTRGQASGRWLDLPRLLQAAPLEGARLQVVVSERRWPSAAQLAALVDALAQQPRVTQLRLTAREEVDELGWKRGKALVALVGQLRSGIAERAPHVTSLQLDTGRLQYHDYHIMSSLSQLPGLQQLAYNSPASRVRPIALEYLSRLSSLTSLHIRIKRSAWSFGDFGVVGMMQRLGELSQLESLTLDVKGWHQSHDTPVVLPAWPCLKHLLLDATAHQSTAVRLSADHCSRLVSLQVSRALVPEGVSSLDRLTSLRVGSILRAPPQQQQQPAPGLSPAAAGQPALLQLPQLKLLGTLPSWHLPSGALHEMLALAADCPQLEELDLANIHAPGEQQEQEQVLSDLALLRASKEPLLRLKLPRNSWRGSFAQRAAALAWLQAALAAEQAWLLQPLQALSVQHRVQGAQQRLLSGCSALQQLRLAQACPAVLCALPAQLTALTVLGLWPDDEPVAGLQRGAGGSSAAVLLTRLRRLHLQSPTAHRAIEVLQLPKLTGLTSLVARFERASRGVGCISGLRRLEELECGVSEGLVPQLAGLRELAVLRLNVADGEAADVLEGEVVPQLAGALPQLRQLALAPGHGCRGAVRERVRELAVSAGRALPRCMMRLVRLGEEVDGGGEEGEEEGAEAPA
jgi:hypothetical protein